MIKRLIGGLLLLVLALAIGCMWGVAAAANVAHAYQIAGSSPYVHFFAAASLGADVFKAAAAIGIFFMAKGRLWGACVACCIIWVVTTGWSVRSLIGFSSTLVTEHREIRRESLKTSAQITDSIQEEIAASVKQLAWLRPQMTTKVTGANERERDAVRDERALSLDQANQLQARIDKLRLELQKHSSATMQSGAVADPVGRFLAANGIDSHLNELATVSGFLLLVEISSNIAILAFGPLFAGAPQPTPVRVMPAAPQPLRTPPVPAKVPPRRLGSGLAEIQRKRARASVDGKRAQATAYRDDLVALHGAGSVVADVDVIDAWPGWAQREGIQAIMTPWQLGQQLACVGIRKIEQEGRTHYQMPA